MIAPLIGLTALSLFGGDLQPVYMVGGVMALMGGAGVLTIRRVR